MDVFGKQIETGCLIDDPMYCDPNWRYQVGAACGDLAYQLDKRAPYIPLPAWCADDPTIRLIARHTVWIKQNSPKLLIPPPEFMPNHLAFGWNTMREHTPSSTYMHMLLSAPVTMAKLTTLIVAPYEEARAAQVTQAIRLYERGYFCIRDARNPDLLGPPMIRRVLILGNRVLPDANTPPTTLWCLAAGHAAGATLLSAQLNIPELCDGTPEEEEASFRYMRSLAQAIQFGRLLRGEINTFDTNTIVSQTIDHRRLQVEAEQKKDDTPDSWKAAAYGFLNMMRPKMVEIALSEGERCLQNEALRQKFLTERTINAQVVEDRGIEAGAEAIAQNLRPVEGMDVVCRKGARK